MNNSNEFNETSHYKFRRGIWINDIIIITILLVASLYLSVALLFHQIKVENLNKQGFFRLSLGKKYRVLSKYTCIFIAIASIITHACSIIGFIVIDNRILTSNFNQQTKATEIFCNVLPPVSKLGLTAGSGLVYLFLWFRQRVFYVHSALKVINNIYIQSFSSAIMILWILFWMSMCLVYFNKISYRYEAEGGCQYATDTGSGKAYSEIIFAWAAASVLMQVSLLGLFIYPMIKRAMWLGNHQTAENICLMKSVKKASILASVCLLTDIFSGAVLAIVYEKNTNTLTFSYCVNLFINHLATIACFEHWKKLLWPWNNKQCENISLALNETLPPGCLPQVYYVTDVGAHTSIKEPKSAA